MTKVKRKSQYKRKPRLERDFSKDWETMRKYVERRAAWKDVLRNNPSNHAIDSIADLLARLEFEPDEDGIPQGDWSPIAKGSPLVLLDALSESVGQRPEGWSNQQDTLEWKADVLEAATLVWAGVIGLDKDQIQAICPLALMTEVRLLLDSTDLEAFWNRPGVGKSAADIRAMYERGERIVTKEALGDWLRRARGGA